MPRCWAHSPTARSPGREVRMRVVDDDPAVARRARACARQRRSRRGCRCETTTRSARRARRRRRSAGRARGRLAGDLARSGARAGRRRRARPARPAGCAAAAASSWRSIRRSIEVHDGDRRSPARRAPRAASRPSRPPPMTAARVRGRRPRDGVAVLGAAEDVDAVEVDARDRRHQRRRAGGRARGGRRGSARQRPMYDLRGLHGRCRRPASRGAARCRCPRTRSPGAAAGRTLRVVAAQHGARGGRGRSGARRLGRAGS